MFGKYVRIKVCIDFSNAKLEVFHVNYNIWDASNIGRVKIIFFFYPFAPDSLSKKVSTWVYF